MKIVRIAKIASNRPIDYPMTRLPDYPIRLSAVVGLLALFTVAVPAQAPADLVSVLGLVGDRVLHYYSRAQSIVCLERVMVQQIGADLAPQGLSRTIEYELRVEWEAGIDGAPPDATVHREIRTVNGRPPRPGDEPKCLDPRTITPEPLAFLLPGQRDEYVFSLGRPDRDRNRRLLTLDYRSRAVEKPPSEAVAEKRNSKGEDCVSFSYPVELRGRLWLDPETHDILRVDQSLRRGFDVRVPAKVSQSGMTDRFSVERMDSSVRYRPVSFLDPDETILLPESITEVMVVRGGSRAGKRIMQTYSGYKRFITGGRIVK